MLVDRICSVVCVQGPQPPGGWLVVIALVIAFVIESFRYWVRFRTTPRTVDFDYERDYEHDYECSPYSPNSTVPHSAGVILISLGMSLISVVAGLDQ